MPARAAMDAALPAGRLAVKRTASRRESERQMATFVTIAILVILVVWAVLHMRRRSTTGGGCCGEHEETVRRVQVYDRDDRHYPYSYSMRIGGMTCENCARRVENSLNGLPGVWASVDISDKRATVRCKHKIDRSLLRNAVADAGYAVLDIAEERSNGERKAAGAHL